MIDLARGRILSPTRLVFDYAAHGSVVSILKPLIGKSGWLELSKLTVESLETEERLIFTVVTDTGEVLDDELCQKLLLLPARVEGAAAAPPDLSSPRDREVARHLKEIEQRNIEFFDEEVLKLDHWAEDLKQGLEREIKEIDKQIREARRTASLAAALQDKLDAQRNIKVLESERNAKRRALFEAQDAIDDKRNALITSIEQQLKQRHDVGHIFMIRWLVV